MIASADKAIPYLLRFVPYKITIMANRSLLFKQ